MPDYRQLSLLLEQRTGYDSISTIETHYQDYDKRGYYLCVFPGCGRRTRTPDNMWRHVHFGTQHGLSFGVRRPEDISVEEPQPNVGDVDDEELRAMEAMLLESVAAGHLEVVGVDENGGLTFRLTETGKAYVEAMIGTNGDQP